MRPRLIRMAAIHRALRQNILRVRFGAVDEFCSDNSSGGARVLGPRYHPCYWVGYLDSHRAEVPWRISRWVPETYSPKSATAYGEGVVVMQMEICPEHFLLGTGITTYLPDGYEKMDPGARNFFTRITCSECGRVLKPAGTRPATDADRKRFGRHIIWVTA